MSAIAKRHIQVYVVKTDVGYVKEDSGGEISFHKEITKASTYIYPPIQILNKLETFGNIHPTAAVYLEELG